MILGVAVVVLDGAGAGSSTLAPRGAWTRWDVDRITTRGTAATEPALSVLRGASALVDFTRRGNSAISETVLQLLPGEFITLTYAGGTPGARMTVSVEGTESRGVS